MVGGLGELDGDDLLKVAFLLIAAFLALELAGWVATAFTRSLRPVLLVVLALVLLWYYERI